MKKIAFKLYIGLVLAVTVAGIVGVGLLIYAVKFDNAAYDVFLKNRFTGSGLGILLCHKESVGTQKQCMDDHKSLVEIWDLAEGENSGTSVNRIYPAIH